jgi:uncharacterized protein
LPRPIATRFLSEPRIGVVSVVSAERTPPIDKVEAIVGRYLPADAARGFASAELGHPAGTFVLFTARPDRWSGMDFSDAG